MERRLLVVAALMAWALSLGGCNPRYFNPPPTQAEIWSGVDTRCGVGSGTTQLRCLRDAAAMRTHDDGRALITMQIVDIMMPVYEACESGAITQAECERRTSEKWAFAARVGAVMRGTASAGAYAPVAPIYEPPAAFMTPPAFNPYTYAVPHCYTQRNGRGLETRCD